jgi:16S rRNA G966 N2-methylase RsmD
MIYVAPPQYQEMAARALGLLDTSSLLATDGLVIVQIHPKERPGVVGVPLKKLVQTDERRYGSTLLLFFKERKLEEEVLSHVDTTQGT